MPFVAGVGSSPETSMPLHNTPVIQPRNSGVQPRARAADSQTARSTQHVRFALQHESPPTLRADAADSQFGQEQKGTVAICPPSSLAPQQPRAAFDLPPFSAALSPAPMPSARDQRGVSSAVPALVAAEEDPIMPPAVSAQPLSFSDPRALFPSFDRKFSRGSTAVSPSRDLVGRSFACARFLMFSTPLCSFGCLGFRLMCFHAMLR